MFKRLSLLVLTVCAVCFLAGCRAPGAGQLRKPQLPTPRPVSTIELADTHTQGIALARDHLWTINSREKMLLKIRPTDGKLIASLEIKVPSPRGLAWDGGSFWCTDDDSKMVHQLDPDTGAIIRSVPVPIYGDRQSAHLEAVAWDGKHLWVAYSAGWSSRIHRMAPETGEVTQSMFAKCLPRGLAADAEHLWVLSYNGGRHPGTISRRTISDDAGQMNLSRTFVARTQGREPAALAVADKYLWVADRDMKVLQRIEIPSGD